MTYTLEELNAMVEKANERGGSLDLRSKLLKKVKVNKLRDGDYKANEYIYADDILTHVKRRRKIGDYVFYQGRIPGRNVIFDGENYAHCKSFKDGVVDLEFKKAKDRGADQYRGLNLDSEITKDEAITMYRIITGACRQGTEIFLSTIKKFKKTYTVREIMEIVKGQYGSETFARFFKED
jgi:hypothetical protein